MSREAPRWALTLSRPGGGAWSFVSGSTPLQIGVEDIAAPSIVSVAANEATIDPFTRGAQPSTYDVTIAAAAARGIEAAAGLIGRTAVLYVGAEGLPWGSWLARSTLFVQEFDVLSDGAVTLRCVDLVQLLFSLKVSGAWVATHPADVVADVIGVLPGGLISSALPAIEASRTHWSVTRAASLPYGTAQGAVYDPRQRPTGSAASMAQPVSAYLGDLIAMLGWTFASGTAGQVELRAARTATDRDLPPEDVRRVTPLRSGQWMTRLRVEYLTEPQENLSEILDTDASRRLRDRELEPQAARRFVLADANTLADHANVDAERDITATWANAAAAMEEGYPVRDPTRPGGIDTTTYGIRSTTEQIPLIDAPVAGVCGFRWRASFKFADALSATAISGVVTITGIDWPRYFTFAVGDEIAYCAIGVTASHPIRYATITAIGGGGVTFTCATTEADHTIGVCQLWIAQHPDDRPSPERPVYLQIRGDDDGTPEIVRVTRPGVPIPYRYTSLGTIGGSGSVMAYRGRDWPRALQVDIERAQLGTTANGAGSQSIVSDVTIPYAMAAQRFPRFARGCPMLDVELSPLHADLQRGDVVTLERGDLFSRWHLAPQGATRDVRWEVVGVTPDLDNGCVKVALAWLSQSVPAFTVIPTAQVDVVPAWVDLAAPPRGSCYWPPTTGRRLEGPVEQIEGTTDLTASVWIRPDRRENGHVLMARWGGGDNCWRLVLRNDGSLRFYAATSGSDSTNYISSASSAIVEGAWTHVVVQYSQGSPATTRLFINGQLQTTTLTGTLPTSLRASAAPLCIGADSAGGGQMSEVYMAHAVVWAKALTGPQVLALISANGSPAAPPMRDPSNRPVAWWPLGSMRAAHGPSLTEQGTTPALIFGTEYP
jgi:hypothetical protein